MKKRDSFFPIIVFIHLSLFSLGQKITKDTTFILREVNSKIYHAIFIDNNKNSKYSKWISDFTFNSFDSVSYKGQIDLLKEYPHAGFKKVSLKAITTKWIPLYLYKNRYYAYAPSDRSYNKWIKITDSTFIEYDMEGPMPSKIRSFSNINQRHFALHVADVPQKQRKIDAYIIDPKNEIAVFEFSEKNKKPLYRLMVSAKNINRYPVIVNFCVDNRTSEMEFDTPNFLQLVNATLH